MSTCGRSCDAVGGTDPCSAPSCYQRQTDAYLPNLHLLPGLSTAQQHLAQALDDLYVHLAEQADTTGVVAKVTSIR